MADRMDELFESLFGGGHDGIDFGGGDDEIVQYDGATDAVEHQLADSRLHWVRMDEATYRTTGIRLGAKYAEATLKVDEEAGTATFFLDSHITVGPEHVRAAKLLARHVDNHLKTAGLRVTDEGRVVFESARNLYPADGDDVDATVGRAISTIHAYAGTFLAIDCGMSAWDAISQDTDD